MSQKVREEDKKGFVSSFFGIQLTNPPTSLSTLQQNFYFHTTYDKYMPGKHVRFAPISTAYSPAPLYDQKLPQYASSSRSSASVPQRSYTMPYSQPRATTRPTSHTAKVHTLLAYSHHPGIHYDVSLPPASITTSYSSLSKSAFSEPAVYPPVSSLMIEIPHYSWPISVYANLNRHYVTVGDVFDALYHSLRRNITPAEYQAIPSKRDIERVRTAYEMRYRRLRDRYAYAEEKKQGVKRVDFLKGHTRFMGLTASRAGVWILNVE